MSSQTSSERSGSSSPAMDSESRGSSVSTALREEYEDLLRYAVVTPVYGGKVPPKQPSRPHSLPPGAGRGKLQAEMSKVESEENQTTSESEATPTPTQHQVLSTHLTIPPPSYPYRLPGAGTLQTDDITGGSHDMSHDSEDIVQPPVVDPEVTRLETQLDTWCLDLKRNVLAEFDQSRLRMMERHQVQLQTERQQHNYELRQVQEELERYKELVVTYEQSIARKDHIIASLTKALQKQKERVELQRSFSAWNLRHTDDKRESFTTVLAKRHCELKLKSRVWAAWFGVVQGRWKHRMEKACQSRAEEVCVQLTNEYGERLAAVHRSLDESRQEVANLKAERELYEENMKKAFMRGVCALNLEAMTMFRHHDTGDPSNQANSNGYHSDGDCTHPQHHSQAATNGNPPMSPTFSRGHIQSAETWPVQSTCGMQPTYLESQLLPKTVHLTADADTHPRIPLQSKPAIQKPQTAPLHPTRVHPAPVKKGRRAGLGRNSHGPSVTVERHVVLDK